MAETRRTAASTATNKPSDSTSKVLANEANPTGATDVSTGPVGDSKVIDAQEHVLGDDPRRVAAQLAGGFHDSQSGRAVDQDGNFVDSQAVEGEGPIPAHRIVSSTWAEDRDGLNNKNDREGNTAPSS